MFTTSDIAAVFAYNKTANIFRITETKRVQWDVRNMHKQHLNTILSSPLQTADQFAQLKQALQQLNPEWLGPLESALEQLNFVQAVLYTEQYQTLLKGSD